MNIISDFIADWLLYIFKFEQLEIYIQKEHNKIASLETIENKIKEDKLEKDKHKIKQLSEQYTSKSNEINNENEFVTIEYENGKKINGRSLWQY